MVQQRLLRTLAVSSRVGPLAALLLASACGAGTVGEAVRPDAPTGAQALQGSDVTCKPGSYAEPLVVDLAANQRVDFEAAMTQGVAIVHYDCKEVRLLKDCRLGGDYGFAGVSRKEQVISIDNQDELHANLPFSSGAVGGAMARGATLDLALVYVGRRSTAAKVARPALEGSQCGEATHFVRAAVVGAFAMKTGTKGKVASTVELFGVAAGGQSSAEKNVDEKDGDLKACEATKPSDTTPPEQCRSAIRFELVPIVAALPDPKKKDDEKAPLLDPCPEGFRLTEGKCKKAPEGPRLCDPFDMDDCKAQCDGGNLESCHNLAQLAFGNFCKDKKKGAQLCAGTIPDETDRKNSLQAMGLWKKACDGGVAAACYEWGGQAFDASLMGGKADPVAGKAAITRACDSGHGEACLDLGMRFVRGNGVDKDTLTGLSLYQRACKLGDAFACQELGRSYFMGENVARDAKQGDRLLSQFCEQGDRVSCYDLGTFLLGIASDDNLPEKPIADVPDAKKKGRAALARACELGNSDGCDELKRLKAADK